MLRQCSYRKDNETCKKLKSKQKIDLKSAMLKMVIHDEFSKKYHVIIKKHLLSF